MSPDNREGSSVTEQGERYNSTRKAWENIWDSASVERELEAATYRRAKETLNAYLPYLPKDDLILEAGSGLSAAVITLRRMGYPVIGLDYAENALRISRRYDPTLPLLAGDVHALPHPDNSLGAYLSFGVLEHFEHGMGPALAEAYRVVKPGGILVLTIPYPNVVHQLIEWRRRQGGQSTLNDESFYESTYTRAALCDNVTRAGFKLEKVMPTSHAFTLWGLGGPFRRAGYYQTSALADSLGGVLRVVLPWPFNFSTLVIGRK
jgi:SAM-dependent methyltransferase